MGIKDYLKKAKEDLLSKHLWKAVRAEFLGSIIFVVFGCSYCVHSNIENSYLEFTTTLLSFGICLSVLIKVLGPISGGHFNPAVTIAFMCARYVPILKGFCYIFFQLLGSLCGAAILYGLISSKTQSELTVPTVRNGVNNVQAFGFEFLSTFIITLTYFSTLENKSSVYVPCNITCGLSMSLSQIFAFKMTGGAVNPARAFGPALVHFSWENHWVYWVGPVLGGIFGGFTFEYTAKRSEEIRNFHANLRQSIYSLQQKEDGTSSNSLPTELVCDHEQTEELQM